MELIIGLIFVTSWVMVAPRVIADSIATMRMSKAGEFDLLDKDRERRASRAQRRADAWAKLRAKRNRQAGGDGDYRPGFGAYLGDIYHGFWEDQLEKRQAARAARPAYVHDPDAPTWHERLDQAIIARIQGMRAKTGQLGRLLIEPVGGNDARPATDPVVPDPDADEPTSVVHNDQHTYCVEPCGPSCVRHVWRCDLCGGTEKGFTTRAEAESHFRQHNCDTDRRPRCNQPGCYDGRIIGTRQWPGDPTSSLTADQNCDRCGWLSSHTTGKTWDQQTEEFRNRRPIRPVTVINLGDQPTSEGDTVNTATGDVHDVETCKAQCEALLEDLTRIDTALDIIDVAIRSGGAATEGIEAWLASKNADASVPGMRAAMDALNADRVKELMDAVTAAKRGVQDTLDSLIPLEEANALVGTADGSILNGR